MKYKLIGKLAVPVKDDGSDEALLEWARAFENPNRIVDQTHVGEAFVSTVFLGLDHNFTGKGEPLLFETMIFLDGWEDEYCERYATWDEAERGHQDAIKLAEEAWKGVLAKREVLC